MPTVTHENAETIAVQVFKNVGMTTQEALEMIHRIRDPKPKTVIDIAADFPGLLLHNGALAGRCVTGDLFMLWPSAHGADVVHVDGDLSIKQLESLVWWMKHHLTVLAQTPPFDADAGET